jgi:phage terminase large subunit-like protein
LGGRGAGKTRAGAEWVMNNVLSSRAGRIALIGETLADVRDVMIEGPSGIKSAAMTAAERPRFHASKRQLCWSNGAQALAFSAEDPDSLRGHEFDLAWCDEFAKWRHLGATFDNLQLSLRAGERPRQAITTTPRNRRELIALLKEPGVAVTRATTFDNSQYLAPSFLAEIARRYGGTRLERQEMNGELLEDVPGALWTHDGLDANRVRHAPEMSRIVVAVDPPVSSGEDADECGIVAAGKGADGRAYVLADRSVRGLTPMAWAQRALALYRELQADAIVAEVNQGGDLVKTLFRQIDANTPVVAVHAARDKWARAQPVAALYEQARVAHVGAFAALEDQMCAFGGSREAGVRGQETGKGSPDRVDALVWALWELMLRQEPVFRVRRL